MKRIFLISIVSILLFSSCTTVEFEKPQPIGISELKEFPNNLIGTYISKDIDTIIVTKNSCNFKNTNIIFNNKTLSSGDMVLKKYSIYYVLSIRNENLWEVFNVRISGNDMSVYYINLYNEKKSKETIDKLKKILVVKQKINSKGTTDYYYINPTLKEFDAMLKNNLFTLIGQFKKIK